jgi:cytochrome c
LPEPRDLPLALPADSANLEIAVVLLFMVHILFVALMVGGSVLTVIYEIRGRRDPELDTLAREIGKTVTVNKSLAVVLGVGPLLVMNALYTIHFYSANALTGTAWLMVIPLVSVAFLITYAHKYSWDLLRERKGLHIALGASGAVLFLLIPLIFLANINLMLFPDRWGDVRGFLTSLLLPNVLPRYVHFLIASIAISGLFLAGYLSRRSYPVESLFSRLDRPALRREMAGIAFGATTLQLIAGPLLLGTLPPHGWSWAMLLNIGAGAASALVALWLLWRETVEPGAGLDLRFLVICCALGGTVVLMTYGRHLYREQALQPHRAAMAERTTAYRTAVLGAGMRAAAGTLRVGAEEQAVSPGERSFRAVCMACHDMSRRLVGPPVSEIAQVYEGNPEGLIQWVRSPGRKRPDYPEMPPISLSEDQYRAVADYVLSVVKDAAGEASPSQASEDTVEEDGADGAEALSGA